MTNTQITREEAIQMIEDQEMGLVEITETILEAGFSLEDLEDMLDEVNSEIME